MRKPLTPLTVEPSSVSTLPPSSHFAFRSKRSQTINDMPARASKRPRKQLEEMMSKKWLEESTCTVCKKKSKAGGFLTCTVANCSNKIHRFCLPPQFGKKADQNYECNSCQKCLICKKGFPDGAKLLKCFLCLASYHSNCYRPSSGDNIRMVKEKRFSCSSCQNIQKTPPTKSTSTADRSIRSRAVALLATVREASDLESSPNGDFFGFSQSDVAPLPKRRSRSMDPSQFIRNDSSAANAHPNNNKVPNAATRNHNTIDDNNDIPDASAWTMNEVYEYFKKIFSRQAHVFEEEDIDGEVLYQLTREDVVGKFKLKFGHAIKVYGHIKKMQEKRQTQL